MDSIQKYMLIGPLLLIVVLGVAILVKRQASKPRSPDGQLYYAQTIERRLASHPAKATAKAWRACIAQYERVFKVWPESKEVVEAYAHIGTIYKKYLKDRERAKEWYDRVLREFPDSEVAEGVRRERTALATGEVDTEAGRREAVAVYTDFIEHNPDSSELDEILLKRGILYIRLKEAEAALADFERVIAEFPRSTRLDDAVFYIGDVYRVVLKDGDKALEQYDKLITDYPKSNQIRVAHKRKERIWERRVGRKLDEYFRSRYGVKNTRMFFTQPATLYRLDSKEDYDHAEAADKQTLDLKSAELTVAIDGTTLVVSGSLVIANPSELDPEEQEEIEEAEEAKREAAELRGETPKDDEKAEDEKKDEEEEGPAEAKTVWLMLNEGMELRRLTQGEATLEFKQHKNLVEITLAEPIPLDGETTLTFEAATAEGKDTPGMVIGEDCGHAFAHAFWFPITKLDDAFESRITFHMSAGSYVLMNRGGSLAAMDGPRLNEFECRHEPVPGRFFVYAPTLSRLASWGERGIFFVPTTPDAPDAAVAFLDEAVKAADFLLAEFGNYPYDKLVIAQSPHVRDTVFEHGAGLILVNDQMPLESIKPEHICNELVQQWYGCQVYPYDAKWLWYTAGVASYYETLYLKERYGEAAMEAHLAELRDLYAEIFANIGQRPMVYLPEEQSETVFDGLVYTKGAYFVHTLRWLVGDESFVEAQRAFLEKNAFEPVSFRALRIRFDKASGRKLLDVFSSWLFNPSTPALTVEDWSTAWSSGQVDVMFTLAQADPKYELAIEIAFEAGDQRVVNVARITKRTIAKKTGQDGNGKNNGAKNEKQEIWSESFAFTVPFNPERIVLDPNFHILLDPKNQRIWQRPESADEPADELILDLDEASIDEPVGTSHH